MQSTQATNQQIKQVLIPRIIHRAWNESWSEIPQTFDFDIHSRKKRPGNYQAWQLACNIEDKFQSKTDVKQQFTVTQQFAINFENCIFSESRQML